MSESSPKDAPSSADRITETTVAYTTRSTTPLDEAKRVADLTVGELREIIRQIVREEQHPTVRMDDEGYLVFQNEAAYAAYLDARSDKYPSELRAYYIDSHGFKVCYSDYEPTPEKAKELEEIRREPTVPGEEVFSKLRDLGIDV
jgi:hypothetical protein